MFTELGGIVDETGLSFSEERSSLYGEKRGFGVTVSDTGERYVIKLFCKRPFEREDEIFPTVVRLGESLPKNTLLKQFCEVSYICVELDRYSLLQENVILFTEFLDKLTEAAEALGLEGDAYSFPRVKEDEPEEPPKGSVKIKLGFDLRSVAGLFGAALGACAMVVIAVLAVNAGFEIGTFGLKFEVSTYILSALTAVVVYTDYRFISRKLDACGVIACPVFTLAAVVFSGLGAGVKACAQFFGVSFVTALNGFPDYLAQNEDIGSFMFGYVTRGIVTAVVACIIICVFYFERHPDETIKSEKFIVKKSKDERDDRSEKR